MTVSEAYEDLKINLLKLYNKREAGNIADMVIEKISGLNKIKRILNKQTALNNEQVKLLHDYTGQLLKHKPVQYVLHEAWFAGMKLYVDENVLIPRPETEELVEWIFSGSKSIKNDASLTILDIGTGSGCIAIALKKKLTNAEIFAFDNKELILKIASANAKANNAEIHFFKADINNFNTLHNLPVFDVIVSNPPYIIENEINEMSQNVILYEPNQALFVPDENPLQFYKSISNFAVSHLKKNGCVYFEINEVFGNEVSKLLSKTGFHSIEIKNDLQGKQRMVKAAYKNF